MKNSVLMLAVFVFVLTSCKNKSQKNLQEITPAVSNLQEAPQNVKVEITPIRHASMILGFYGQNIYVDPVGGGKLYENQPPADFVLITHEHSDHLDVPTLSKIVNSDTQIFAPEAVKNQLPAELQQLTTVLKNGETKNINTIKITAFPMYNLRAEAKKFHPKGKGNGYVLSAGETKLYIAGDTGDIPEMRDLKNIDIAFIPMNLPYTMPVGAAADAVLDFEPKKVYPYHYKGKNGLSNVEKFKNIIQTNKPEIEVVLLDWYPKTKR